MIGINLEKKYTKSSEIIKMPIQSEFIIPFNKEDTLLKQKKDEVKTGEIIGYTKDSFPIFSSVTGTIKRISKDIVIKTKEESFFKYENESDKISDILKQYGIRGLSGSFSKTYLKYESAAKTLIVNALECEPYVSCDYAICINYIKEIKKMIETLILKQSFKEVCIVFPNNNLKLKELFTTYFANNENVRIMPLPNLYPLGWEKSLVRFIKHVDYVDSPLEVGCIVSNVSTIYAMYEAYFLNKPLYQRVITVVLKDRQVNVLIKNGTKVKDVLTFLNADIKDKTLILSGLMRGRKVNMNTPITLKDNSLFCIDVEKVKEEECIRCGKCVSNCPVKINPVLIKEAMNTNQLKRLHPEDCIECSICSYICPAAIPLKKIVTDAKKQVLK